MTEHTSYQFRDSQRRVISVRRDDVNYEHFVQSYDGRLKILRVQVADPATIFSRHSPGWERKEIYTKMSPLSKILYWTWSSTQEGSKARRMIPVNPYLDVAIKWIPSCAIMLVLFFVPQPIGGEIRINGFFDPVRERDRYYAKAARNPHEENPRARANILHNGPQAAADDHTNLLQSAHDEMDGFLSVKAASEDEYLGIMNRPLRPRLLCFLVGGYETPERPENAFEVRSGEDCDDEYIFVSYTRRSFSVDFHEFPEWASRDRADLLQFAIAATRAAGKGAFWIDFECVAADRANTRVGHIADSPKAFSEDVYRICDVLRGAFSMAVIHGPPSHEKGEDSIGSFQENWARLWASRLWVLPELLLAPTEKRISVYTQKCNIPPGDVLPLELTKRELAARSCSDAEEVRQLIEHYDGNTLLTPLELVQLALRCLRRRATVSRTEADLAYALKGLLRRRPQIVPDESGFEAFASLSLANDSQRLLERLVCILPPNPDADWSDMTDAWGMQLWDIEPTCQVAGIVDRHTVLLDGAYGASVRWNQLETVAFIKRDTAFRTVTKIAVRAAPLTFTLGIILVASSRGLNNTTTPPTRVPGTGQTTGGTPKSPPNPPLIIGALILSFSLMTIFAAPYLLYKIYLGKFWSTQAWFLGIEGRVEDLAKLERSLFGFCENRLTWSANGSLLSKHRLNDFQECEPVMPEKNNVRDAVRRTVLSGNRGESDVSTLQAERGTRGERRQRVFTLIDTYSLTVTHFYAYHPPTAVFLCGQEGGMQRAVLCSYDWKTQTYCRETVIRMKTLVLERMFRVDRFRFAMKRS